MEQTLKILLLIPLHIIDDTKQSEKLIIPSEPLERSYEARYIM